MLKTVIQEKKANNKLTAKEAAFGFELLLDLYDCRPGVCDDLTLCYQFLDEIVDYLGMEKQAPPNIFRTPDLRFPDKAGLSGWAPLVESSVVIHTLTTGDNSYAVEHCCLIGITAVNNMHTIFCGSRLSR